MRLHVDFCAGFGLNEATIGGDPSATPPNHTPKRAMSWNAPRRRSSLPRPAHASLLPSASWAMARSVPGCAPSPGRCSTYNPYRKGSRPMRATVPGRRPRGRRPIGSASPLPESARSPGRRRAGPSFQATFTTADGARDRLLADGPRCRLIGRHAWCMNLHLMHEGRTPCAPISRSTRS